MKTINLLILILFILMITETSCVHYYYAPSSNNVPLFKAKNEVRLQASSTATEAQTDPDGASGFEIQSAYAVGNHTGLQLNFFHASKDDGDYGSGYGNYIEGAGGYFKSFGHNHLVFETYAGGGIGGVKNIYGDNNYSNENASTSIGKFFVQPSFGFTTQYFNMAVSSKFSLVNIGLNNSTLSKENNPYDYDYVQSLKGGKTYFFWEPGIMIRGGFKHVQAIIQLTETVTNNESLPVSNINLSIGLIVPFKIKSK